MIAHCGVLSFLSISSVKSLAHLSLPIRWGLIREIRFSHRLKVCVNINISTAVTPNPPSSSSGPHQTNQLNFSPRPAHSTHFQKHQAIPKGITSTSIWELLLNTDIFAPSSKLEMVWGMFTSPPAPVQYISNSLSFL